MTRPDCSLRGKVAIVTGGSRGIGQAIALALAEAGADVAVCSRELESGELASVANQIENLGRRSLAVRADISSKPDVESLVQAVADKFGHIDILVNNAGNYLRAPLLEISEADWNAIMDTHLKGYMFCCQAVGNRMVAQKRGSIINIASALTVRPAAGRGAYSIAKAGVVMLTRILALELGSQNVRVNTISPGMTRTKLIESWFSEEAFRQIETEIPLGRLAIPEDITGAAVFLASDSSAYITGQTIVADGGRSI